MFTVSVIIILSSAYAGIFEATGFLNTTQARLAQLGEKITPYGSILLTATITSMATCNQTLSSILTYQLHKDSADNMQQLALDLENSTIVVAALIPWSIACAVPLATVGAGNASILFAFYLYLLPLYNLCGIQSNPSLINKPPDCKSDQVVIFIVIFFAAFCSKLLSARSTTSGSSPWLRT